jgi:hypothetical protein
LVGISFLVFGFPVTALLLYLVLFCCTLLDFGSRGKKGSFFEKEYEIEQVSLGIKGVFETEGEERRVERKVLGIY